MQLSRPLTLVLVAVVLLPAARAAWAGVLPEERADALYHRYQGGGVTVSGPSVLVRKNFANKVSVSANYYVDMVSSASIDVVTTASPYSEQRTQESLGLDYLHGDTLLSIDYTGSDENDYSAHTLNLGVSQDVFGGLTTITMGYTLGNDEVGKRGDPGFSEPVDSQHYRLGLTQVLSRNLILGLSMETITDEGYLNNPYRSVRYLDSESAAGYSYQPEVYPGTRTSNAFAMRSRYHLPGRGVVHGEYRYFQDTWGIRAHGASVGLVQPVGQRWTGEVELRFYTQEAAEFFADLFDRRDAQNFLARDKELSTFDSRTLRLGGGWDFASDGWGFIEKGQLNFYYDHTLFNYKNFRDLTVQSAAGEEPLYSFSAGVIQAFVSLWF